MLKSIHQLLLVFIITTFTSANAESNIDQHKDKHKHGRIGSHGMVLITDGNKLFASHLPLYSYPHDYQLIYSVSTQVDQDVINYLINGNGTVTILPDIFDLNLLINHPTNSYTINAKLYKGHFERGGKLWSEQVRLTFKDKLFQRKLAQQNSSHDEWTTVALSANTSMYIHNISDKPSFDSIVITSDCPQTLKVNANRKRLLHTKDYTLDAIRENFRPCEKSKVVYFETADFSM